MRFIVLEKNRTYCKKHGIRLSESKLGRPSKDEQLKIELKQIERQELPNEMRLKESLIKANTSMN